MSAIQPGQVAVVTGAAAGIGLALAQAFAQRGLRVALADCDEAALGEAAARLRDLGTTVLAQTTDVSDRAALFALRDAVLKTFGAVDIVCNNAGIYEPLAAAWEIDIARWQRLFAINYWGVVHGIQAFVPLLVEQGHGHVVNTASMSGLTAVPSQAAYSGAKHAVVSLSESLRADLDMAGATGVGVTILCPALVRTPMGERALDYFAHASPPGDRERIGSGPNLASVLEPAELAAAALQGIEENRLHVTPTPGSRDRFVKRVQPILDNWWPA